MGAPKNIATVPTVDPFDLLVAALDAAPVDNQALTSEEAEEVGARIARAETARALRHIEGR